MATLVLDVLSEKNGILECALLVYPDAPGDPRARFQRPQERYSCELADEGKGTVMPYRIWEPVHGKTVKKYLDPRLLKKVLKDARATVLPSFLPADRVAAVEAMYKALQLGTLERAEFCYLCRSRNAKYIKLEPATMIPLSKDKDAGPRQNACEACGWSVLLDRLERLGVKVTPGLREILAAKFKKIRDIDTIERTFDPKWNPVDDENYSLFDVCDVVPVSTETKDTRDLPVHPAFKEALMARGVARLLPVQVRALGAGLLRGKSMLVASSTSSGKTLIGELAGIDNILSRGSGAFLFVVPLVALANQKYKEFKKWYEPLGLRVAMRVGQSRIDAAMAKKGRDPPLRGASIVVGTYEGVDYLFRAGKVDALPRLGTIVIDEIQMFKDEERGTRLDGFIARLKHVFPDAQLVYLSATVASPKKLAKKLGATLVEFFERPVPVERHLVPCLNETEKVKAIARLVAREHRKTSSHGFKGQTIVFTNARRSVHELVEILQADKLAVEAYHSGLTYGERLRVERDFERQRLAAVVTTAALGAGVDLPASQVIFHSLAMGIEWLTVAEFNQMLGRAGRYMKHDSGRVYLLVEPGKSYHGSQGMEEDKVALKLLTGSMEDAMPAFDLDKIAAEILAFASMTGTTSIDEIEAYHGSMLVQAISAVKVVNYLHGHGLVSVKRKGAEIRVLPAGKAICESFLDIEDGVKLKKMVKDYEESVLDIAAAMNPLKNVYVTNAIVSELVKVRQGHGHVSSKFFDGQVLDFLSMDSSGHAGSALKRKKLSALAIEILARWSTDIFTCECEERPHCEHGPRNLAKIILDMRRKHRLHPRQISQKLKDKYQILLYAGDVYDFLDSILHGLEAIQRFATIFGYGEMIDKIAAYKASIEA